MAAEQIAIGTSEYQVELSLPEQMTYWRGQMEIGGVTHYLKATFEATNEAQRKIAEKVEPRSTQGEIIELVNKQLYLMFTEGWAPTEVSQ